jgi:ABC-type lipoprotein release transport system permease subunit
MTYSQNTVPLDLFSKVMAAIAGERARLRAVRNFIIASLICIGALVSTFFVWNGFVRELVSSGFGQFASLIFLDFKAVIANWQDYGMSLLESFPAVNAAELVGEAILVLISTKLIITYAKGMAPIRRLKTASNN